MHGIGREVLEIFSERDGDAFWRRRYPVAKAPNAKIPQHLTALPVKHLNQKGGSRLIRCSTWCAPIVPMPKFHGSHEILHLHTQPLAERVKC